MQKPGRDALRMQPCAVRKPELLQELPSCMQVMGAPIAGSDLRAQILTGGGLRLKNLRPRIRSRRLQMLFWATGTERRGLVSLEAKKQKVGLVLSLSGSVQAPHPWCHLGSIMTLHMVVVDLLMRRTVLVHAGTELRVQRPRCIIRCRKERAGSSDSPSLVVPKLQI